MELKNDVALTGTLHSVDQYLNVKLTDVHVVEAERYPQLVSVFSRSVTLQKACWPFEPALPRLHLPISRAVQLSYQDCKSIFAMPVMENRECA